MAGNTRRRREKSCRQWRERDRRETLCCVCEAAAAADAVSPPLSSAYFACVCFRAVSLRERERDSFFRSFRIGRRGKVFHALHELKRETFYLWHRGECGENERADLSLPAHPYW